MKINNGYFYLIGFLILEGLFPIFVFFGLKDLPTLWLVAFGILISIIFGLIIFFKEKLYLQYKDKEILFPTFMSALFLGIGGLLYFLGIKYSSPSIASILLLLQSFFAFIIFNIFGKEEYTKKQIFGAILMFIGGIIILYEGENLYNFGALIMFIAGIVFTIGNFYTKKASLKGANPFFLLINRNFLMVFITSFLALFFNGLPNLGLIKQNFIWIFLIGFLILFIGKALWITALTKLNSFVAISSFPVIPLLVLIFSFFILGDIPSNEKLLGFIPIILGSILLLKK